jgi:hypothetical protein
MTAFGAALAENPFFVLGLSPDVSRIELEREAQKLLGMLELGFAGAATYSTPLGPRTRTPELVRAAVAALRDPQQRLVAELWARHAPAPSAELPTATAVEDVSSPGLRRRLGWGP